MSTHAISWSTEQLTEFLAAISVFGDEETAARGGIERAAESFDAEVGALVRAGSIVTSVGFPIGRVPKRELLEAAKNRLPQLELPGVGAAKTISVPLEDGSSARMILARVGGDGFAPEEVNVLGGMARILGLALGMLRTFDSERALRESLQKRQSLLEKSASIQSAISRRVPLQEVLEAITDAAGELLGDEVVGLRMVDPDDPGMVKTVASRGVPPTLLRTIESNQVGEGIGGRAIVEGRLVVAQDYARTPGTLSQFAQLGLQAAMAAPVYEKGTVIGSLVVASYDPVRTYKESDQETLLTFAQHASLALMDAKTVDQMLHQALHDGLTGLPNRALFLDRLEHALARAGRENSALAVLFLDLDRFKGVNDSLGHAAGDELLAEVARRVAALIRAADTAARLGGDEFAILIEDLTEQRDAARLATRILEALRHPFVVEGEEIFVTGSIGIALGGGRGDDPLRNADFAMYRAKSGGRDCYEFFEEGMRAAVVERLELESDFKRAVEREEFVLHYQPIVELETGSISGLEALLRWEHPARGLVPPLAFVPLAEETGAIVSIGRWVLREACRRATTWEAPLIVSVNLSARQLQQPDLVDEIAQMLADTALDPSRLMLELTETALMQDSQAAVRKLSSLKQLGIRLALDDFGTGYSSLGYLQQFPLDVLKIAKPFVDGLGSGSGEPALAQAIIELGRTFQLNVVAEGIERVEQLVQLRTLGCDGGQGFLFSKPCDADSVDILLRQRPARFWDGWAPGSSVHLTSESAA